MINIMMNIVIKSWPSKIITSYDTDFFKEKKNMINIMMDIVIKSWQSKINIFLTLLRLISKISFFFTIDLNRFSKEKNLINIMTDIVIIE